VHAVSLPCDFPIRDGNLPLIDAAESPDGLNEIVF